MADATDTPNTTTPATDPPVTEKDVVYWQAEARKAFTARDEIKNKLRDLEGRVLSDDDRKLFEKLRADAATTEEQRKRKEGEFDTWRADILKKHEEAVTGERTKREAAEVRLRQKLIGLEFAAASTLFGDNGKTVLTPDIAEAYFGRNVDIQTDDDGTERVVVKGPDGHVIISAKTGKPAGFVEAMEEVIAGLPNRDRILRGSGKAGSGSPGGSKTGAPGAPDLQTLTERAAKGDKDAIKALKDRRSQSSAMVFGSALSR